MLDTRNLRNSFVIDWLLENLSSLIQQMQVFVMHGEQQVNEIYTKAAAFLAPQWTRFSQQIAYSMSDAHEDLGVITNFSAAVERQRVLAEAGQTTKELEAELRAVCGREGKAIKRSEKNTTERQKRMRELTDEMRSWRIANMGDENAKPVIKTTADVKRSTIKWFIAIGIPEILAGAIITAFLSDYISGIGLSILLVFVYTVPALYGALLQAQADGHKEAAGRYEQLYGARVPRNINNEPIILTPLNPRVAVVKRIMFWLMILASVSIFVFRLFTWLQDVNNTMGMFPVFVAGVLLIVTLVMHYFESGHMPKQSLEALDHYDDLMDEYEELSPTMEAEEDEVVEPVVRKTWWNPFTWFGGKTLDDPKLGEFEKKLASLREAYIARFAQIGEDHRNRLDVVRSSITNTKMLVGLYDQTRKQFLGHFRNLVTSGLSMLPADQRQVVDDVLLNSTFDSMFPTDAVIGLIKESQQPTPQELAEITVPVLDFNAAVQDASVTVALGIIGPTRSPAALTAGEVNDVN